MVQKLKNGLRHPIFNRIAGISIGSMISFSMVLGSYKTTFDTMQEDVKFTKNSVQQITVDVAILKTKVEEHSKEDLK